MRITSTLLVVCIVMGGSCLLADGTQTPSSNRATKVVFAKSAVPSQVEETAGAVQAEQPAEAAGNAAIVGEAAAVVPSTTSAHEVFSRIRCMQHSYVWAGSPALSAQLWCGYSEQRAKEDSRIYQNVFSSCPSDICCRGNGIGLHGKNGYLLHGLRRASASCGCVECASRNCKNDDCGNSKKVGPCDQVNQNGGKVTK